MEGRHETAQPRPLVLSPIARRFLGFAEPQRRNSLRSTRSQTRSVSQPEMSVAGSRTATSSHIGSAWPSASPRTILRPLWRSAEVSNKEGTVSKRPFPDPPYRSPSRMWSID
jgi:hypothetical protein